MFQAEGFTDQAGNTNVGAASDRGRSLLAHGGAAVGLSELARLLDIAIADGAGDPTVTFPVRRVKQGESLHRAGDRFDAIYVVRSGFFKSVSVDASGAEVVQAFPMGGDVVGLEGVDQGAYAADVVALDASTVVVVTFGRLADLGRTNGWIARLLYTLFSRELLRTRLMTRLLGTLSAEERLATLLLDLSNRFGRLGFSRASFALRMTRQEIGGYIGIKLETVSRTLSAMAAAGLIDVDLRTITLRDLDALQRLASPEAREDKPRHGHALRPHAATVPVRAAPSRRARAATLAMPMPAFA